MSDNNLQIATLALRDEYPDLTPEILSACIRDHRPATPPTMKYYTRREAAEVLSISTRQLDRLIAARTIKVIRIGRRGIRIPESSIISLSQKRL